MATVKPHPVTGGTADAAGSSPAAVALPAAIRSSAIAVSGLRKAYGDKIVLDGIDLDVRAGTVFALLGPNGAGKTTTVNVLTTLIKADSGTVRVPGTMPRPRTGTCARSSGSPVSSPRWTTC